MLNNAIKTDLSRALVSWRFLLSIILMFLVWELNSKRFQIQEDVIYLFVHVWGRSITPLLAVVITSFSYASSYSEDIENNFLRYCIIRISIKKYVLSKIFICFIVAFLVVFVGTILFVFHQCFILPIVANNSVTISDFGPMTCFQNLLVNHTLIYMIVQTFFYGLFCGAMSVLSLAFSTFIRNSYGVFVIPFLLHYCFFYIFTQLSMQHPMFDIEQIYNCISTYTDNIIFFIAYAIFITVMLVFIGYAIMYKKVQGEYK